MKLLNQIIIRWVIANYTGKASNVHSYVWHLFNIWNLNCSNLGNDVDFNVDLVDFNVYLSKKEATFTCYLYFLPNK